MTTTGTAKLAKRRGTKINGLNFFDWGRVIVRLLPTGLERMYFSDGAVEIEEIATQWTKESMENKVTIARLQDQQDKYRHDADIICEGLKLDKKGRRMLRKQRISEMKASALSGGR